MESFDRSSPGNPEFLSEAWLLSGLRHSWFAASLCGMSRRVLEGARNALRGGNRRSILILKLCWPATGTNGLVTGLNESSAQVESVSYIDRIKKEKERAESGEMRAALIYLICSFRFSDERV